MKRSAPDQVDPSLRLQRLRTRAPHLLLVAAIALLQLAPASVGWAQNDPPRPYRFPDIHRDFVVFAYAGDLWRVPSRGGTARRLTAHEGVELFPRISPDGKWIAFSAEYTGARQVYVMPAEGGAPRQLTFYTDVGAMPPRGGFDYWIQDWTPGGKILVRCNRTPWGERMGGYCVVDPAGGLETRLPIPQGGSASLAPDGQRLAYTPTEREFRTWKRTRGGRAQDLWIYDLAASRSQRITEDPGTDNFPMWVGDQIYFTSDRDLILNLFAYDTRNGRVRQLTHYRTGDVLWPQHGPEAIVFYRDGQLYRFDLERENAQPIAIAIDAELPNSVPAFRDVAGDVQSATLSPSAKRVVFEARGELLSVPQERGPTRNLSRTPAARERAPAWSPDGNWIAYLSDIGGEYELYVRRHSPIGENQPAPRQLTHGSRSWMSEPVWSHDGKRIAWSDSERRLRVVDVASEAITEIDHGTQGNITGYVFSPDDRWLAYQDAHPSALAAIKLYAFDTGEHYTLGDGLTADTEPAWSADGDYLFFISNRDYQPRFSSLEFNFIYDRSARIFAFPLTAATPPLFPPRSDEEEGTPPESAESTTEASAAEAAAEESPAAPSPRVDVETDGFTERTIALPGIEPGVYSSLVAAKGALYYLYNDSNGGSTQLQRYDLERRKSESVLADVAAFVLTPDGSHLLYRSASGSWGVIEGTPGHASGDGKLDLSDMRLKIDPRVEWRELFRDGWRIVRDFFYDPSMHGLDWDAVGERYGRLVEGLGDRSELDFVFGEMEGELDSSHAYVGAAAGQKIERVEGGKLGCELELDSAAGRYRIARIFQGENWDDAFRSPLREPGVDIHEGDYLLAIDGIELGARDNPYRLLEGKGDVQVALEVAASPDGERRTVAVRTLTSEGNLRYIDWVKSRISMVDRLSDGRIGYIHLPDTAFAGNRMLQKLFYGQARKQALIIDDRYNGGGFIPDRMIEMLSRHTLSYWARREIDSLRTPGFAHNGPKVMLINSYSSSGGDALPYYFREEGLGLLIGTRTWGGLIGLSGAPSLADGGSVAPPSFRIYDTEGNWVVENQGVSPDIEVFDLPEALARGEDPSIERAVQELLGQLEQQPVAPPPVPRPPNLAPRPLR